MDMNNAITFRAFGAGDMQTIIHWFDQDDFYYYSTYPRYVAENEIESFLIQRGNTFIIEEHNKPVGLCDFHLLDSRGRCCNIEIAFAENDDYKDKGSQILKIYLNMIFQHIDILKINKLVYSFDKKSLVLCQQAGMTIEGAYEQHIFKNGEYHDLVYLAIMKNELNP